MQTLSENITAAILGQGREVPLPTLILLGTDSGTEVPDIDVTPPPEAEVPLCDRSQPPERRER